MVVFTLFVYKVNLEHCCCIEMHVIWNVLAMKICPNAFFPRFQLTMPVFAFLHVFSFAYLPCYQLLTKLRLNLVPDFLVVKYLLWYHRNIEWHCISWVLVVLRYTIAKYILWCLDKKRYDHLSIYLIAFNIPSVFLIIASHTIRKHGLVYINCKFVNYLPLLVKTFRCNLVLTKFETRHLYYIYFNPLYFNPCVAYRHYAN